MTKNNTPTFENLDLVAYIVCTQGIQPKASINSKGRVIFQFDQDVSRTITSYYDEDAFIHVREYVAAQKNLKTLIYQLKGSYGK
jgi:hypothetical protein